MNINYTVKKMTLKDSTKEHIEVKLRKLEKYFSSDVVVQVILKLEKNRVTAEITIRDKGMIYRAEDIQTDLTEAFDNSFDTIIRKIRKQKTRLEKKLRSTSFEPELITDKAEEDKDFEIVRVKRFAIKPLHHEEAILQMKLLGHKFYMFRNQDTDEINLVYERNDGKYGLIEPE